MNIAAKTEQDQTTHEHSIKISKTLTKGCKHIKKPMSIPAKTQKDEKTHEHSIENEQGLETHQKTMSITAKTHKNKKKP